MCTCSAWGVRHVRVWWVVCLQGACLSVVHVAGTVRAYGAKCVCVACIKCVYGTVCLWGVLCTWRIIHACMVCGVVAGGCGMYSACVVQSVGGCLVCVWHVVCL